MLVLSVVVITYLANAVAARWRPSGLEGRLEGLGWADSDEPTAPTSAETTSQGATT